MDVSDISTKAPAVVKTPAANGTNTHVSTGKPLPVAGKSHSKLETPHVKNPPSQQELNGLVDQANKALEKHTSTLKFTVADGTDIRVIRVVDTETGKLIRQIPSEQMVAIAKAFKDIKSGVMLEDKA